MFFNKGNIVPTVIEQRIVLIVQQREKPNAMNSLMTKEIILFTKSEEDTDIDQWQNVRSIKRREPLFSQSEGTAEAGKKEND